MLESRFMITQNMHAIAVECLERELEVITAHYLFCCVALLSTIHVAYHSAPYFSSTSLCYITLLPTSLLHHSATFNWVRHSTLVRKHILSHTYP